MATLSVRVNKNLDGWDASSGALAYVYLLSERTPQKGGGGMKLVAGPLAVPVGPEGTSRATVNVDPGQYFVQVRMPSGSELNQSALISTNDQTVALTLEGDKSPHEWLSVDHFLGRTNSGAEQYSMAQLATVAKNIQKAERFESGTTAMRQSAAVAAAALKKPGNVQRKSSLIVSKPPVPKKKAMAKKATRKGGHAGAVTQISGRTRAKSTAPVAAKRPVKRLQTSHPTDVLPSKKSVELRRQRLLVEGAQQEWDQFRNLSQIEIKKIRSDFPVWQIDAALPTKPDAILDSGTHKLDDARLLRMWTGSFLAGTRASVTVSDEFFLKATLALPPADLGLGKSSAPAPVLQAFGTLPPSNRRRGYFTLLEEGKLSRLGVVPLPWEVVTGGTRYGSYAHANLLIQFRRGLRMRGAKDYAAGGDIQCGISVDDPNVLAILGFLKSGNLVGTSALIGRAQETLFAKVVNPYAAAAAGYVLLQTFDPSKNEAQPQWQRWIANLGSWFDAIPDGAIQRGWLDLQNASLAQARSRTGIGLTPKAREYFESARQSFLEAIKRGIPFYPQGIRMLLDGLTLISESDASDTKAPGLKAQTLAAMSAVRWLSLRTDANEVFTVLKLSS